MSITRFTDCRRRGWFILLLLWLLFCWLKLTDSLLFFIRVMCKWVGLLLIILCSIVLIVTLLVIVIPIVAIVTLPYPLLRGRLPLANPSLLLWQPITAIIYWLANYLTSILSSILIGIFSILIGILSSILIGILSSILIGMLSSILNAIIR